MIQQLPPPMRRIQVVDALRGFAVMAIMFLHNIEHFNFYDFPTSASPIMQSVDKGIWEVLFFLFAGKAYAIFSLLFGFSFFIQSHNQIKKGKDFRLRFLWRLFLLFFIGCFNGAFFPGDILVLYSIVGVVMVLVCTWSDRAVLITAIVLMLQPFELGKFIYAMFNPDYVPVEGVWLNHMQKMMTYLSQTDFWAMVKSNLWDGQLFSILWAWDYGRFFQTASLFMLGMLIGRRQLFKNLQEHLGFWKKTLIFAIVAFVPLYFIVLNLPGWLPNKAMLTPMNTILSSFRNFSFMCIIVSTFMFVWEMKAGSKILHILVPYGKMSLTNYLMQSIIGSFIYFSYGLGLYNVLCTTASFAVAIGLFIIQLVFSNWWLSHFKYGPFEYLWRRGTWICSANK